MLGRFGRIAFAAILIALAFAPGSKASTIPLVLSDDKGKNGPSFYVDSLTFTLPIGFTGAALNISSFAADDRAVLELNGVEISNVGIFGPGPGSFFFTDGGPNGSHTFINGNNDTPILQLPGATFEVGLNTLTFIVNNTNDGIDGGPAGGPTQVQFEGSVTFAVAAVPEPGTWVMMIVGFCGMGFMTYRRASMPRPA